MSEEDKLWAQIQAKEAEVRELRNQHFVLTQKDEETELREKYLGRYYYHKQYNDRWNTYIYVNNIDVKGGNRLNCTLFTIIYEDDSEEIYGVSCENHYDFSCHYLSKYDNNPTIEECVEIKRDDFLKAHELFLTEFLKSFKV
jgi:hypothetical protein